MAGKPKGQRERAVVAAARAARNMPPLGGAPRLLLVLWNATAGGATETGVLANGERVPGLAGKVLTW